MKNSPLFKKLSDGSIQCVSCCHRCVIPEGKLGKCRVRGNKGGEPFAPLYGRYTVAVDPIEKKPLYHFLPGSSVYSYGTVGCNFSCQFCQNSSLSMWRLDIEDVAQIKQSDAGRLEYLTPESAVKEAIHERCQVIASTYNEPTVSSEFSHETFRIAKEKGLYTVYVTNGYESPECLEYLAPYLDAVNIDLKSFSDDFYQKVLGARLQPVLDTIKRCYAMGIHVEVTTLVIPKNNDSDEELTKTAEFIASVGKDIPWHLSAYHDAYKYKGLGHTPFQTLKRGYEIGKKAGIKYIYLGNVQATNARVTFCPNCGKDLIDRSWFEAEVKMKGGVCPKCGEKIPGRFKDAANLREKINTLPDLGTNDEKPSDNAGAGAENIIVYATQGGTSEEVAQSISQKIGFPVVSMESFTAEQLMKCKNAIFCVATYGRGAPPSTAAEFWANLQKFSGTLSNGRFAVIGMGNSAYKRTFVGFAKSLEQKLNDLGMKEIVPLGKRDDDDDDCDAAVSSWIEELAKAI